MTPSITTTSEIEAEKSSLKKISVRADRDARILAITWRRDRYKDQVAAGTQTTDSADSYAAILTYIQALRDVPAQEGFPSSISWPTEPT